MRIGTQEIGASDSRALVIAEAGVNHNGDLSLAHRLIDVAADSAADAVKFQTFSASAVVTGSGETAPYQEAAGAGSSQRAMLERLELPLTAWAELRSHAVDSGLLFLSTAFDIASLELLTNLGVHAVPIAVSNLRAIQTMGDRHQVPVGWSDHTTGNITAIAARALGAAMFEKHLTLDRTMVGPDHQASAEPAELSAYVEAIRACESALGNGKKEPVEIELENRRVARRSYYASRDIEQGEDLGASNTEALRPVSGVPASERLAGRKAARAIVAGAPIEWDDLE